MVMAHWWRIKQQKVDVSTDAEITLVQRSCEVLQFNLEGFEYKLIFLSYFVAKYWIFIIRNKGRNIFPILFT